MPSFWSRLGSWLRRTTEGRPQAAEPVPEHTPTTGGRSRSADASAAGRRAAVPETPRPRPTASATPVARQERVVRLGLDFGTTTTLIAVRVDEQAPRLVQLEAATDWMPSYYWQDGDGTEEFGARAENLPAPVHSIKLRLPHDEATPRTYGLSPSRISLKIIEETLRRALVQLKRERLIPAQADRLEVATNVGCSAAWDLTTRARLRDIAGIAGLTVTMANVIEEPIAAAVAVLLTGAFNGGRLLLVDIGGGTLDACVLKAEPNTSKFTIYASNGRADLGGDRYTDLIADRLRERLAEALSRPVDELDLDPANETRLWQIAEQAKRDLSTRPMVRVRLPDVGDVPGELVPVEREWFEKAARELVLRSVAAVNDAYRIARLVLDRGTDPDDQPGTPYLSTSPLVSISSLHLREDGLQHLDHVVLVGGASQMPMIRREFESIFGNRLEDPALYGLDPLAAVAFGLAQHQALESLDFGYPNWAIGAAVTSSQGVATVELYTPFGPIFKLRTSNSEMLYSMEAPVPPGASSCQLEFRRVAPGQGVAWREVPLPPGTNALRLDLSLLGDISLMACVGAERHRLYEDRDEAPWKDGTAKHPDWLPKPRLDITNVPDWDPVNDGPG